MRLATFIILSFLSCVLSSKLRDGSDRKESHVKIQTSNLEVTVSDKNEQTSSTSTDILRERINTSSDYKPLFHDMQKTNANIHIVAAGQLKYAQKLAEKEIGVATDVLQSEDSDGITYISAKETNQTRNGIRHEYLNASRISEGTAITKPAKGEQEDEEERNDGKYNENKLAQEEKFPVALLENTTVRNNIAESWVDHAKSNTSQELESFRKQSAKANEDSSADGIFPAKEESFAKKANESSIRVNNTTENTESVTVESVDLEIENQTAESRTDQREDWEPGEDDLAEAANFGLQAMHNLYYIQEPKLYSMGLYLGGNDPARYVAAFNDQSEEARNLARFGYATLQGATVFLKKFPGAPLELPLSRSTRRTSLEQQCPRRGTPQCPLASLRYRTSDGSCNNLQNLWWGSAMSTIQRFLPAVYDDGVQTIRRSTKGKSLPSARDVTNLIHEDKDVPLASITHMLMQWGQFVDHDLTATGQSRGFNGTVPQCCLPGGIGFQPPEFMHPECLPIAVNLRDSFYGPLGVRCLEFLRSGSAPKEGCEFGTREQLTQVTSYLDASMVYSSNALHSDSLRIFRNGLLQYGRIQSRRPLLPKLESDLCKRGSLSTTCFRAGDGRLSEQPALTSLHVVFLRLHNRIATELSALNSHWSDEKLFQETRRIVGAVVQHITYREFLPIILGPQVMKIFDLEVLKKGYYEGYDPTVNPTVANAFSTAAYRFGHSLVQRSFVRFDSDHRPLFNNVSIHDEFRNPVNLETAGSVDRIVLGLVNQPCQRRDEFITEEITNHLFQTPGFAFGMDLASLNIQRGRDHGLPPYVRWREPCGLSPIKSFEDLDRVMSPSTARKFKSLYSSVEDIDLFPAGLAERSVVGGLVGPTFACIIGQQFSNLRRGDRFWYENPESESSFTAGQLQQIRRVTLAQVLCKTMDGIETVQPFVFLATDELKNQRVSCDDPAIGQLNFEFWAERPSEFRHANDPQKTKRTMTDTGSLPVSRKEESANARRKVSNNQEQSKVTSKPFKTSINQNNKIVLKRPFGRPDNFTIVVQNNAVNAPVFVNDGIFGSHVRIQQQPTPKPISSQGANSYPAHRPHTKPIPTTIPHSVGSQPYVPHAFNDPSNPNPLVYGYKSSMSMKDDVFYDNYSPTSPRPTLYTYYTNFQQKPTTQPSNHEVNGYLINYGSSHHKHDSFPTHNYERPKPSVNPGQPYELHNQQKPVQQPNYDSSKLSTNARPVSRPNYGSSNESYHTHKPGYDEPSTISRPNIKLTYELNGASHHGQISDYNRQKVTSPVSLRPNDELYHKQKPIYDTSISPATSRPNSTPNYQSHSTSNIDYIKNPHLQNNGLSNESHEGYSTNSKKTQNGSQKRPIERPYDQDDPDVYQKRPNVQPQNELYSNAGTNVPSQGSSFTGTSNSSPVYSSKPIKNYNSYDRYSTTPIYQKIPALSTQNGWTNIATYTNEASTPVSSFGPSSSAFYQKTTNRPVYQNGGQSQFPSYSKEPVNRPLASANSYEQSNSYQNPTGRPDFANQLSPSTFEQSWPTPISHWSEVSTISSHAQKQEEYSNSKPIKVQSVTIVTESIDTVHNPGHSGYISQHRVTSEIPKPLPQHTKNNKVIIRKPGQYYYEQNVLHRYPDEVSIDQIPPNNPYSTIESKELVEDRGMPSEEIVDASTDNSTIDDYITNSKAIEKNENKSTTLSTLTNTDYVKSGDNASDEGVFSTVVENVTEADVVARMNHWMNPQEDPNLPSMLEMPRTSDEIANKESHMELPKPIKSRSRAI